MALLPEVPLVPQISLPSSRASRTRAVLLVSSEVWLMFKMAANIVSGAAGPMAGAPKTPGGGMPKAGGAGMPKSGGHSHGGF